MRRRRMGVVWWGLALVLVLAGATFVHTALAGSWPAKDERLTVPPTELRLTYTTPVDPRLARVELLAADSMPLRLDSLRAGATAETILAPVLEPAGAGEYTVAWLVIGSDGHPVRGRLAFIVEPPAYTAAPLPAGGDLDPDPMPAAEPPPIEAAASGVNAPAYVATRWLTLATILVIVGAVTFRGLVLGRARQRSNLPAGSALDEAAMRAAGLGRGAAFFLLLAIPVRAMMQARALDAGDETAGMMRVMLFESSWGWGVLLQAAGALLALVAFQRATRQPRTGWTAATLAALILALTPALSGHAAAVESLGALAIAIDGVHVLAASAWLGTLAVLLIAGVPAVLRSGGGSGMVADLVAVFSPLALMFAAIVVGTGTSSALLHFDAVAQLWTTPYGRTLLVKLAIVAAVALVGAYNWRAVRPRIAVAGPALLRRTAGVELLGAAVILIVTALLIATPTP